MAMNPPPVPMGKARRPTASKVTKTRPVKPAKSRSDTSVPSTPTTQTFNSSDGQDTPMTGVSYLGDDEETPRPPLTQHACAREYPVVKIAKEEPYLVQTHKILIALRQYHLLHSIKDRGIEAPAEDWNKPESGMLGVAELISIVSTREFCIDQHCQPNDLIQVALDTANTRDTHEFVTEAADLLMDFLRKDHDRFLSRLAFAWKQLEPLRETLNQLTIEEDDMIGEKNVKTAYYTDQLLLRELVNRAFDIIQEMLPESTYFQQADELRRIAAEWDFAVLLDNLPSTVCELIDLTVSTAPAPVAGMTKHGEKVERDTVTTLDILYGKIRRRLTRAQEGNALMAIALGILGPRLQILAPASKKYGYGYAKFEDYPPIVSPIQATPTAGLPAAPALLVTPAPAASTKKYTSMTPNPGSIRSIHAAMPVTPQFPSTAKKSSDSEYEYIEPESPSMKLLMQRFANGEHEQMAKEAGLPPIREEVEESSDSESENDEELQSGYDEVTENQNSEKMGGDEDFEMVYESPESSEEE